MALDRLESLLRGVGIGAVTANPVAGPCFWVKPCADGFEIGLDAGSSPFGTVCAALDWPSGVGLLSGGAIVLRLSPGDRLYGLTQMLVMESESPRCGAAALLSSYVEGLMVHLLREAIGGRPAGTGLLAGLAEPRLARAIVAMQKDPARLWTAETLADEAGMSRSSFMERFRAAVGQTPMAYLRGWRMVQAQGDLAAGARVAEVARRYGYRNADAFSRAFRAQQGQVPSAARLG